MKNEAITVNVPPLLYLDLAAHLRKSGDSRTPGDLVAVALKNWLNSRVQKERLGYQWRNVFLPDGTELRMRYQGVYYYASIRRDQLVYCGDVVSPRAWALMVTGTVRNAWRDVWIRRSYHEMWTQAATWRTKKSTRSTSLDADRRHRRRRSSD